MILTFKTPNMRFNFFEKISFMHAYNSQKSFLKMLSILAFVYG